MLKLGDHASTVDVINNTDLNKTAINLIDLNSIESNNAFPKLYWSSKTFE